MISHSPPPAVPPQLMLQAARDGDDGSKLSTITDTACTPRITGDTAFAISYLQILVPDRVGPLFDVPNHGSSRGFHVHRVSANRWEFVRTDEGWKIKRRTLRPLDGTEPAREILGGALEP